MSIGVALLPDPGRPAVRVELSVCQDELHPGPADSRMYVVDPVGRKKPYRYPIGPPFRGTTRPPPRIAAFDEVLRYSDADHHCVHLYAASRFVLEMWERYLDEPVVWWFSECHCRLELVAHADFHNARAGFGYLETGKAENEFPFALSLDVIAHEMGHHIAFSVLGHPDAELSERPHYTGFHEAFSDISTVLALLQLPEVLDEVLTSTGGDLHRRSPITRVGKLGPERELRSIPNSLTMSDVRSSEDPIRFGAPLRGFMFDVFADLFEVGARQSDLGELENLRRRADLTGTRLRAEDVDTALYGRLRYRLKRSREKFGRMLAMVIESLCPDELRYDGVVDLFVRADARVNSGHHRDAIFRRSRSRELGP